MHNLHPKIMAKDWHIRFFVTPKCNFACKYCNPESRFIKTPELSTEECKKYLRAAIKSGIKSIHWTGGEPLIRSDLLELISYSKKIGFKHQVITTNGYLLEKYASKLFEEGLSRINLSLDTLDEQKFKEITGRDCLKQVLSGLEEVLKLSKFPTKLNVVVTKSNLEDAIDIVKFALGRDKNNILIKLICVNPNNPTMLSKEGIKYYEDQVISYDEIINEVKKLGSLKELGNNAVIGDNPNCKHFLLKDLVNISILAMPSWDHPCALNECKKLRISPFGQLSPCLSMEMVDTRALREEEISKKMVELMRLKCHLDKKGPQRKHYSPDMGKIRFGETDKPIDYAFFQEINRRKIALDKK